MSIVLGPLPCKRCHSTVFWDKVGSQWRLIEVTARGARVHKCRSDA